MWKKSRSIGRFAASLIHLANFQGRCVSIFKDKTNGLPTGYALGSIEGTLQIFIQLLICGLTTFLSFRRYVRSQFFGDTFHFFTLNFLLMSPNTLANYWNLFAGCQNWLVAHHWLFKRFIIIGSRKKSASQGRGVGLQEKFDHLSSILKS